MLNLIFAVPHRVTSRPARWTPVAAGVRLIVAAIRPHTRGQGKPVAGQRTLHHADIRVTAAAALQGPFA